MSGNGSLSQTDILAAASSVLCRHGFAEVESFSLSGIDQLRHRLFEDAYTIVAVISFSSWKELSGSWIEAQASLVELMSEQLSKDEFKAWEGYLVLLTTGVVPTNEEPQVERIRYDTARIRKLVSTGSQLREVSDVEDALLPVLPLQEGIPNSTSDAVMNSLPELLHSEVLHADAIRCVVNAFLNQEPLAEAMHKYMGGK
ncbi:MAG: hypothetical protein SGI77_25455 [Pirellulaceae bacterium]|nr:hypothetical protein [Pirellulaceae bacterium]